MNVDYTLVLLLGDPFHRYRGNPNWWFTFYMYLRIRVGLSCHLPAARETPWECDIWIGWTDRVIVKYNLNIYLPDRRQLCSTLKMETAYYSETLVASYEFTG